MSYADHNKPYHVSSKKNLVIKEVDFDSLLYSFLILESKSLTFPFTRTQEQKFVVSLLF